MKRVILLLALIINLTQAFAQRTLEHTVYFHDMDGFSGHVKFETFYEGFATRLHGRNAELTITGYNTNRESIEALNKAGLNLKSTGGDFKVKTFSIEVNGRAAHKSPSFDNAFLGPNLIHFAPAKLILTQALKHYTTPEFDKEAEESRNRYKKLTQKSLWEVSGDFIDLKVTEIYLSDLKTEIEKILGEYQSKNQTFDTKINTGTSEANNLNVERAEYALAKAKEYSNQTSDHNKKIRDLESLIAKKKKEKQEIAKKEEADEAKEQNTKESPSSGKSTQGSDSKEKDEDKKDEKESKSSKTVYIPKTASQMYNELKEMTNKAPGMLNDPKIRQQLRYLEVDANREQQTMRDYRAGAYNANRSTLAQYNASNQKIDNYTKAVGNITDGVTGLVNDIIAAGEEKERRRQAERDAEHQRKMQGNENNKNYVDAVFKERINFIDRTISKIENNYKSHMKINVSRNSFKAKSTTWGKENEIEEYYLIARQSYLVADDFGKFGLLDDDGSVIYPPQFDVAFRVRDDQDNKFNQNFIAVMAENRWGLLYANGSIALPMEYDYIYFLPDYNLIAKKGNEYIFIPNGELIINGLSISEGQRVNASGIKKYFPEGIIPSSSFINKKSYHTADEETYSYYVANATYNHSYSQDEITSLVDLNGKTIWPKLPQTKTTDNISLHTALQNIEDLSYYRIKDTWYAVTKNNNTIHISPTEQKEFVLFNLGVGTSVIDRKEKVLTSINMHISAPFGEDGLAPVARRGYTNKQGEIVISKDKLTSNTYDPYLGEFKNGFAVVATVKGYTFNAINTKGEKIFGQDKKTKESVFYSLGWNFSNGSENFPKDKEKAFYYYKVASEMGSADAMNNIGVMYMEGDYVAYDVDEAINWYKKAAENGNNTAAKNLGFHYRESNVVESVKWFEQAAKSFADAQYELAVLYHNNEEVKNLSKSTDWFKRVADNTKYDSDKRAIANYCIGQFYERQSDSDLRKLAKDYFIKAAQAGQKIAKAKLEKKVKKNEIATFNFDKNNDVYLVSIVSYDFKKNQLNGLATEYYQNGKPKIVFNYANGKLHGEVKNYDETGKLLRISSYKNGELIESKEL